MSNGILELEPEETPVMTKREMLDSLRILYGDTVMCTDGLYHMYTKEHNEIYINPDTKEKDRRSLYRTLVVTDQIVVAEVVNIKGLRYVVLRKSDLECLYESKGTIYYLDENMLYDQFREKTTFISHTGNILIDIDNVQSVKALGDNKYLVSSRISFNDTIILYRTKLDLAISLVRKQRYLIYPHKTIEDAVEIVSMQGGKYVYNFKRNECINTFTGKAESMQIFEFI